MTRKPRQFEVDPDPLVVVGFDAEWTYESAGRNLILSNQFAILNADTGRLAKLIELSKNGERIELERGLTLAMIRAQRKGVIDRVPRRFIVAAHFSRADLSTFEDFGFFKRNIGAVRKSYATTELPLQLQLVSTRGLFRCSAVVVDTMMLSPAGTSLETIGKLLGVPKIDLPEGYSKDRMDLFLRDHPKLFRKYAITDAIIPALYVAKIYGLLPEKLGINRKVITLGGAAVELVRKQAKSKGIELNKFLGNEKPKRPLAHLATLLTISAQAFHGGYNVAIALGFSPDGKELQDLDIKAAYTTALAFISVPDWQSAKTCTEIEQLAVVDTAMTAALVEFRFPDGTRFPCLPVRASNKRGLVYPLEGESWCTGPELVVARELGAILSVKDGYRIDWIPGSIRLFEDITRLIGKIRAEAKALDPPDLVLDKMVKEIGNSVYGKLAQGVAGTRIIADDVERRSVFNTLFDVSDQMGPSGITCPPMAAYCTGLVRALLLETLNKLPPETWIGTATTDGFLSSCSLDEIDQKGPVATAFRAARERLTPGDDTIWEVKHVIPGALVTRTRGTFTVAPEGWNGASVVMAKSGYRTPESAQTLNELEQCRVWIKCYRERTYETMMRSKTLTSLREQHLFEVDLQTVIRDVRWNMDYDLKRKLINARDEDGLITADTVPWRSIGEFEQAREVLDNWKKSQRRVLKTRRDYDDMLAWGVARSSRRRIGTRSHNALPPVAAAVLKVLAHRMDGALSVLEGQLWRKTVNPRLNARAAKLIGALCGVNITETTVKDAKRRGAGPAELPGCIEQLTGDDRVFLTHWFTFHQMVPAVLAIVEMLCRPGSAAAEELDDLFDEAFDQEAA